jgi:predicted amidohydrolase
MQLDLVLRGGRLSIRHRVSTPSRTLASKMAVSPQSAQDFPARRSRTLAASSSRRASSTCILMSIWGGTSLGVDPLRLARGGCTTLVDAGSAGPGNCLGFLEHVIRPSARARVLAFLNVSFAGIYGFARRVMVGEGGDLRLMAPAEAVEVANANRDTIVGI